MDETKFIRSIDARFPYGDPRKSRVIAARALKISPNAVFSVYHELARPCRTVKTTEAERLAVLDYLAERFVHPLSGLGAWLARKLIANEQLSVARAAEAARTISAFPGCYGILNLAYFSCTDRHGTNEPLFEAIRVEWEAHLTSQR